MSLADIVQRALKSVKDTTRFVNRGPSAGAGAKNPDLLYSDSGNHVIDI